MRTLVWFRGKDLRLSDHAPLCEAIEQGEAIPLFVVDPYFFAPERAAELPHRMQYLLESLVSLRANLQTCGSELVCVRGHSVEVVPRLVERFQIDQVFAYRWTEPVGRARDRLVRARLRVPLQLFEGETLLPPETVRTQTDQPFSVFTPFARAAKQFLPALAPRKAPSALPPLPAELGQVSEPLPSYDELRLTPNRNLLVPGEPAAQKRLSTFLSGPLVAYPERRDLLAEDGTSRLSADLKFGTLSVSEAYDRVSHVGRGASHERFLTQLLWREFAYATLWDRPRVLKQPFRREFTDFPWVFDELKWAAWTSGQTGYPVVDAAARQLLTEGYVHNRARMVTASFLTKHLLIDYRHGEKHYLKYLTDGDWAINNMSWQWSAGCGVDAQPYFRVFNPVIQGERFDPDGAYVRRYVPELSRVSARYIHRPWEASLAELDKAGVRLGKEYPFPIVEHEEARRQFLKLANRALKDHPSTGP